MIGQSCRKSIQRRGHFSEDLQREVFQSRVTKL